MSFALPYCHRINNQKPWYCHSKLLENLLAECDMLSYSCWCWTLLCCLVGSTCKGGEGWAGYLFLISNWLGTGKVCCRFWYQGSNQGGMATAVILGLGGTTPRCLGMSWRRDIRVYKNAPLPWRNTWLGIVHCKTMAASQSLSTLRRCPILSRILLSTCRVRRMPSEVLWVQPLPLRRYQHSYLISHLFGKWIWSQQLPFRKNTRFYFCSLFYDSMISLTTAIHFFSKACSSQWFICSKTLLCQIKVSLKISHYFVSHSLSFSLQR